MAAFNPSGRNRRAIRAALAGVLCSLGLIDSPGLRAAELTAETLLQRANAVYAQGNHSAALALAGKAIQAEPNDPRGYFLRGRIHSSAKEHNKAIADLDQGLKLQPRTAEAYQLRGSEHFMLGYIQASIADFDKFIEIVPAQEPYHWQRGISYYYAGRYAEGRKQFESHQTVNGNDVENAVWHYLCVARAAGVTNARNSLIKIRQDSRVPMMQVYALFAGQLQPEDVLAAAQAGPASGSQLKGQLFYAHLYLGLFYEAAGDAKLAREHITKAVRDYLEDHYMGEVARVHLQLLDEKGRSRPPLPVR